MEFKYKDITVDLSLYGLRSEMIYENRNNKALDLEDMTVTKMCELLYCIVCANIEKKQLQPLTKDEFVTEIEDKNGGDEYLFDFWVWYIGTKMTQNEVLQQKLEEVTKKK